MKIFATDLDGTLLNKEHGVSPANVRALEELKAKDYMVVFASGRVSSSVDYIMQKAGLNGYIIANNGALVLDENKNIVHDSPLSYDKIKRVTDIAKSEEVYFHMYDRDTFYSNKFWKERVDHLLTEDGSYQIEILIEEDILSYLEEKKVSVYKIQLTVPVEKQEALFEKLKDLDGLYIAKSGDTYIEVMSEGVNKWEGIQAVVNHKKLKPSQVVTIGDFDNDIPMIEAADLGIAMGNANEKVKAVADYVTLTNVEDGFARAVEYINK